MSYRIESATRDEWAARCKVAEDRVAELDAALSWYGEQARLARLIHTGGDGGRHALAEDGGKKARAALKEKT